MLELENDFGAGEGDDCTLKTSVDAVNLRVGAGAGTSLMSGLAVRCHLCWNDVQASNFYHGWKPRYSNLNKCSTHHPKIIDHLNIGN